MRCEWCHKFGGKWCCAVSLFTCSYPHETYKCPYPHEEKMSRTEKIYKAIAGAVKEA